MSDRTLTDIISDIEIWAHSRLAEGEDKLYVDTASAVGTKTKPTIAVTAAPEPIMKKTVSPKLPTIPVGMTNEDWMKASDLPTLKMMISGCTKCALHETRKNFVFGVGNPNAKVMVVGEGPGADEDEKGEPFVGRAGQLLNKMLEAIKFPREEVFIANIIKSRPPGNRDPLPAEVAACMPYLLKQIEILKPKMILCVGRVAGNNLLNLNEDVLGKMRGKAYDFMGAKVMVTYHPAALLRNPGWKVGAWEDLQKFRKMYDEMESA
ncbi:MAG: uracil-DNA glycosylase [bacterium]